MSTTTSSNTVGFFPRQKRSENEKNKKFFEECIEAGMSMASNSDLVKDSGGVRSSKRNKIINSNLFNDIVDKTEIEKTLNPFNFNTNDFPASYRNYPLLNSRINLLCGEERKRIFNPLVTTINSDAVTNKQNILKDEFTKVYMDLVLSESTSEEVVQKRLQEFDKWKNYTYKDTNERMSNQLLRYLYHTQDIKEEFSRGFEDALIMGEEIYVIEIFGGEPRLRKANPKNISTLRSGESFKIEDSDIIVEDCYISIGEAIDRYHEFLSSRDISDIEQGYSTTGGATNKFLRPQLVNSEMINPDVYMDLTGTDPDTISRWSSYLGGAYDGDGNIRVTRVVWAGMRKIGILTYPNEMGEITKKFVPEQYPANKEEGEIVEWIWIKEWYEGTKLGADKYVKCQPCDIQLRHSDNISMSSPGIVGTIYQVNDGKGRGIMDIGRSLQYLYNTFMYKTELAFIKAKGKIGRMPLHMIPDGWSNEKWMYFAEMFGWAPEDAFNEGMQGAAKGKLSGTMNNNSPVIDLEMGNYIQSHIMFLDFIEGRVDGLTGITKQRMGAIDNRETVGGVERSVMQSSHITEKWFGLHDFTKVRALRALLEAAKIAYKNKTFSREFVMDDGTKSLLEFEYDTFINSSYSVDITNASDDYQALQALRQLGQQYLQASGSFALLAELYRSKDMITIQRKIADHEEAMQQQKQQEQQMLQQTEQQKIAAMQEVEQMKIDIQREEAQLNRELKQYEIDANNETRIMVAELGAYKFQEDLDANDNGIPDPMEIAAQSLKERDIDSKNFMKQQEVKLKERDTENKKELEERKIGLEKDKLALEEKKLAAQKQLQKQKDDAAMAREKVKAKSAKANKVVGEK